MSKRRRWAFRLLSVTVVPALFLLAMEFLLWAGGYGGATRFFVPAPQAGYRVPNRQFARRFMPQSLLREPSLSYVSRRKPRGTYRIFVLGASAAQGFPSQAHNFGRIAEVLLTDRYPGVSFDVVNTGVAAINSHAVREIASDAAAMQGDLFVVYLGNNEVIGPFGPGTVFSNALSKRGVIRAWIQLRTLRIGQMLDDGAHWLGGKTHQWRGMEMFMGKTVAEADPRLPAVYANFRQNIEDITDIARNAGVQTLLCTVPVSIKGVPPFASVHRRDLDGPSKSKWELLYSQAIARNRAGDVAGAEAAYRQALAIDDRYAELHYRLASVLDELGHEVQAREHYVRALALDALRFRADPRINAIIRDVCAARPAGVHLVDAEKALSESSGAGGNLPADKYFYEHVHLTYEGNYALACSVVGEIEPLLPAWIRARRARGPLLGIQQCAPRVPITAWDQVRSYDRLAVILDRPPFTGHPGDLQRQTARKRRRRELASRLTGTELELTRELYARAVAQRPTNLELRFNYADLLGEVNDWNGAVAQYREILRWVPDHSVAMLNLGLAFRSLGRDDEAEKTFGQALKVAPNDFNVRMEYFQLLLEQDRFEECQPHLEYARRLHPKAPRFLQALGRLESRRGHLDAAAEYFRRAVQAGPDSPGPRVELARILSRLGQDAQAVAGLREVLAQYPDNLSAIRSLAWLLATAPREDLRNGPEAVELGRRICRRTQYRLPPDLDILAAALAETGEFAEATKFMEWAVRGARAAGQTQDERAFQSRLELYRKGQPYHQQR